MNKNIVFSLLLIVLFPYSCSKPSGSATPAVTSVATATINGNAWHATSDFSIASINSGTLTIKLDSSGSGNFLSISLSSFGTGTYTIASGNVYATYTTAAGNAYNITSGSVTISSIGTPNNYGYVSISGSFSFSGANFNTSSDNVSITGGSFNVPQSTITHSCEIWLLTITDETGASETTTIMVTPGYYNSTFSETAGSAGIWITAAGTTCGQYRINIGGNIGYTITPGGNCTSGDSWRFIAFTGGGCLYQTLGSGGGYSNGCKSAATYGFSTAGFASGTLNVSTQSPYGTATNNPTWTASLQ